MSVNGFMAVHSVESLESQRSSTHLHDVSIDDPPSNENENTSFANTPGFFKLQYANDLSWFVNWFLLFVKLYCFIVSASKAIAAALADSVVDLLSQSVLATAEYYIARHNPDYPVGRSRLEALSVLACAAIMSIASLEVIQFSVFDLYDGFNGRIPELDVGFDSYLLLTLGIFLKVLLYFYCKTVASSIDSDALEALTEDHLNDVISNIAAMITAAIAFESTAWYVDPIGAILISLVIISRWINIMTEQMRKVVGHTAPPEFINTVNTIAEGHDHRLKVDCTRAYHFGSRYNVEMEIILPARMTVEESHDIALALQHKIERMDSVERAFIHVDHLGRDGLEHKVERELVLHQVELERSSSGNEVRVSTSATSPLHMDIAAPAAVSELRSRKESRAPIY